MSTLSTQAGSTTNVPRAAGTVQRADMPGLILVLCALAAVYFPTFRWLIDAWMVPDSNYSHGFWVPLVIAYFLWERRRLLAVLPVRKDPAGLIWIAAALFLHLFAILFDVHFFSGLSLFPLVWGLTLWYAGPIVLHEVFWPTTFMIFMIPLPLVQTVITNKLQTISAIAATGVIHTMGLDVVREGNILSLSSFKLFVEAPCSGLNTLFSLMFVGGVVAYLAKGNWKRKCLLLCTAPFIAIAANIFRIVTIALLGEFYGEDVAMGVFHKGSGIIMYSVGLALFLIEGWLLRVRLTPSGREV